MIADEKRLTYSRPALKRVSLFVLLLGLVAANTVIATGPADLSKTEPGRLQWWQDARFGMFIHWGPVSLKGTEIGWSRGKPVPVAEYDNLYHQFNPSNFNARTWAQIAKAAGMKYLVLTSKHHDGFCLWNTQFTDYNIMNTPFHRDVVKELAAACRQEGIVFCTYHSICDWHHPDYPLGSPGGSSQKPNPNLDRYNEYLKNQLAELIQNYGPLGIMWFDGEWEKPWSAERGADLYQYLLRLQPSLIINNRVGTARKGMAGTTAAGAFGGDYDTPEQTIGKFQNDRPWESCITICQQWAWKPNDPMKSLKECLQTLINCAGGDGNLLFNVGPMPTGEIEPRQVERLKEMGVWLKKYGRTIYGTRGGPFKPGTWGASTHQGNRIYLHVFKWPDAGLVLPPIETRIKSGKILTGGKVELKQTSAGLTILVPKQYHRDIATVIELKLDGMASNIAPVTSKDSGK
jgi:alpha-L-fucosidase